jgi:hypothetical protein
MVPLFFIFSNPSPVVSAFRLQPVPPPAAGPGRFPTARPDDHIVSIQKQENLVEIKACGKFYHRHMVDISRIEIFAQRRYLANWPFMDGH